MRWDEMQWLVVVRTRVRRVSSVAIIACMNTLRAYDEKAIFLSACGLSTMARRPSIAATRLDPPHDDTKDYEDSYLC